jgi:class 3 adenylate cyclase/CRP-like cAMP-binding protein
LAAIRHLRSLRYLVSTYLPQPLVERQLRHPARDGERGEWLSGSILFSDVSGFTALSERLADQGPEGVEQLTGTLNRYFERMLEILAWSGGRLLKFAGDALLAYFPPLPDQGQVAWAVRAAQRMMYAIEAFSELETPAGPVGLRMKVGLSTGRFVAASVGAPQRMEYVVLGPAVTRALAAEGHAEAGLIVVDERTARHLSSEALVERTPRFYAVAPIPRRQLGEFEIRAETGRARRTTSLLAGLEELRDDVEKHLRQLEALLPYLSPELAARVLDTARQRRVESEYRPTTTLFVNVTGFEALLERPDLDAGGVTRLLSAYVRRVHEAVSRYGGIISRIDPYTDGSKILILFGAPVAHEDDPQRALHAVLEMRDALEALNARWRRTLQWEGPPPPVRQRVGVTLGRTFAGQAGSATRREYTVMGDDVNLAARLMSAAQPGQVLLSEAVRAATAGDFTHTPLPALRVKGKRAPVAAYRLEGPRDQRLARRLRDRGPLLGREAELAAGRAVVDALFEGRGGALTVDGAPGVGKSHLADALMAEALDRGAVAYLSESTTYAAESPYAAWVNVLHALAGIGYGDDRVARERKFRRLLVALDMAEDERQGPLLNVLGLPDRATARLLQRQLERQATKRAHEGAGPSLFARLGERVDAASGHERPNLWRVTRARQQAETGHMWHKLGARVATREQTRLYEAFEHLLQRVSSQGPLILYFENAQWMDPASRRLLDHLRARVSAHPVLLVTTRRSEGPPAEPAGAVGERIALEPLTAEGTRQMVTALWERAASPGPRDEVSRDIHRRSGGIPLFIEELVGWLRRAQGDEALGPAGAWASITLQELVLSRVDQLSHAQRRAVKAASVVGDEFAVSELRTLVDSSPRSEALDGALEGLEQARLILRLRAQAHGSFRQTLTRELVYQGLPFARRRAWHGRLVDRLAELYAEDLALRAETLAHHALRAERWAPAARYLLISADKALRRHAHPRAAEIYARVLETLERVPVVERSDETALLRVRAHLGLGDVALLGADLSGALAAYQGAWEALPPAADDALRAALLTKRALVLAPQGRPEEALDAAREAVALTAEPDPLAEAALAWLAWRAGAPQAAALVGRVVERLSPAGGRWAAGVAALMDDLAGRRDAAGRAYRALERPAGLALIACRQGDRQRAHGDEGRAEAEYRRAADLWAQAGDARGLSLAYERQAALHARAGRPEEARRALRRAAELLAEDGTPPQDEDPALPERAIVLDGDGVAGWAERWQRYSDLFHISLLFRITGPEAGGEIPARPAATQVDKENPMTNLELLRNVPMFERLSDDVLSEVEGALRLRSFEAGEVLFNQGDPGDGLFIVRTGRVAIYTPDAEHDGDERPIRIFEAGEVLGEMALIDDQPRSLSARALEESTVLVLSGDEFRRLLARQETLALGVMAGLNERIRYTTDFLGEMRQWVQRIGAGEYDRALASDRTYEDRSIAALAAEFARMAVQVKEREEALRRQVRRLSIQIDQAKKDRQVEEIVESDYFQSLRAQAKKLREQE